MAQRKFEYSDGKSFKFWNVERKGKTVATAYGLNAFPFWVILDPDGVVLVRTAGSLPLETVEGLFANLAELAQS